MTDSGNYYYEVISFGLKNFRATYQRLMDKVFKGLIGRCIEVYVDDIVVKSDSCDQHIKDLEEVFEALRWKNMRLNPEKCTFDVEGGKFFGFMLTHRGIKANLDKCRTIVEMQSPQNIKEVQQLIGREVRRNIPTTEGFPILVGSYPKIETRPTDRGIPLGLRRSS